MCMISDYYILCILCKNTLKIWFQTITYYVCSTDIQEGPRILYWIRIWYKHVHDVAQISIHGVSGIKINIMNIRCSGLCLYITPHLFLCWIWSSPINGLVFEDNHCSLRSFPALVATAKHVGVQLQCCTTSLLPQLQEWWPLVTSDSEVSSFPLR
jgi:hypothetical protein